MTPGIKTRHKESIQKSPQAKSSPVKEQKKGVVHHLYSKYLSDIKNKEGISRPLPVPINEVSKTLSVETFSLTGSSHLIEGSKPNKVEKGYSKDRSTSVEEQESISVDFLN